MLMDAVSEPALQFDLKDGKSWCGTVWCDNDGVFGGTKGIRETKNL